MMKKYLISLLLVLSLCACLLLSVSASQEGYIFDLRDVVGQVESLNEEAEAIYQVTGIAPYFIITENQNGLESRDYVKQFAQEHGFYSDAIVVMDGETSYYVIALGAANDRVTEDELVAMRDAYAEAETYSGGIGDYLNLLFTTIGTELPASEGETEQATIAAPAPTASEVGVYSNRLMDYGDLLTAQEEEKIASALDQVSEKHGVDVVVVTECTLGGKDKVAFADDYYDYNGYAEDGLLLLYCPIEGVRYISTSGKAIAWFDGDNFTELTDAIIPSFNSGDYAAAFTGFAAAADEIIEDETGFPWGMVVLAVIVGIVLALVIPMRILKGELKSVHSKASASDYVRDGSMQLTQERDIFLYHTVSRTEKPKNNSGSGTHTGSSGRSHGGGSF